MTRTIHCESASFYTQDGIRLDADLYYPESEEPLPTLLMRQPYGRKIASTVVYAHPSWYARQGYLVVIQDVRGRGTSTGEFKLFANEVADGRETLDWVASLPQSNGQIGMYGFSYQGMTQLYAAISGSPLLKVLCPAMIAWDLYQDWAYENGAFCLQLNLAWAVQIEAENARRRGDRDAYQQLYSAARDLRFSDSTPANPDWFKNLAPHSFYQDWLQSPSDSEYWQRLAPKHQLPTLDLPVLQIGGWFDPHLRGNLALYETLCGGHSPHKLIIGPWGHLPWGRQLGGQNYGPEAISQIDEWQIAWFDAYLKGRPNAFSESLPLHLFEMQSNRWLNLADFPHQDRTWYLHSSGLAAVQEKAGQLLAEENTVPTEDTWVHDPWRPVPSWGGHSGIPAGSLERSGVDSRTDVVTYTSLPLTETLRICGQPRVSLLVQGDRQSFDLSLVLASVTPQGQVWPFTQTYCRLQPPQLGQVLEIELKLQATCIEIPWGHCLRLSLSGASFPAYAVNGGTGQSPSLEELMAQQVITLTCHLDPQHSAQLNLPVL